MVHMICQDVGRGEEYFRRHRNRLQEKLDSDLVRNEDQLQRASASRHEQN